MQWWCDRGSVRSEEGSVRESQEEENCAIVSSGL